MNYKQLTGNVKFLRSAAGYSPLYEKINENIVEELEFFILDYKIQQYRNQCHFCMEQLEQHCPPRQA